MKLTLATAALIMSLSSFASAATIQVEAKLNVNFTTNAALASTLDSAYTARIGSYSGGALTTTATFADINASWTAVGSYTFATAAAGGYKGSFAGNPLAFTDAAGLAGKNVWVWVTNGSNQNLLMQAFKSTGTGGAGDFAFKADSDTPNAGFVGIKTSSVGDFTLTLGTFTAAGANSAYGGSYVLNTAAAVPEPSAVLLGAFGAIGLLRRRRN